MKQVKKFGESKKNKGFTFVEIIVYMGILSILLTILGQILSSTLDVQLESDANSALQQDARFITARLTYDIGRAQDVIIPATAGDQSDYIEIKDQDGNQETFSLSTDNLTLEKNSQTDNLNGYGSRVSNLSFVRLQNAGGKPSIKISFTVTSTTLRPQGPETENIQTTVGLR